MPKANMTRIIGGFEVEQPASVWVLKDILKTLDSGDIEATRKKIERAIEHHWVVDGFWRRTRLERVDAKANDHS